MDQQTNQPPKSKSQEKEEMRQRAVRRNVNKKILYWVIGLVILAGIIYLLSGARQPAGEDFSQAFPEEGRDHVSTETLISYSTNPPTSGPHWDVPLADRIYSEEKPDAAAVHSLEHGRVWISYQPDIPEEAVEKLESLLRGREAIILSPRPGNDTDIALVAWTRLDKFNLNEDASFDEVRILDFIKRYQHKGPEFIPGHGGGSTYDGWTPES